ncbi:MAG: SDR family oxidoreductase [Gaiellales bacterium]
MGATGYLGSELVRRATGWVVHGTRFRTPADWVALDVRNPEMVRGVISRLHPDCVVHTAYVQAGPDLRAVTAEGAAHVAAAARLAGARLVHLSTDLVFDGERQGAYTERDVPSPITPYGSAKAEAERLVARAHPDALIVRTSLIYGGRTPSRHEQMAVQAAAGKADISFFTDELRCPIAVSDLADGLLELAASDRRGVLHLAGPRPVSRYQFARLVVAGSGGSPAALRPAASASLGLPRPRNCALDSSSAYAVIHTTIRPPEAVLLPLGAPRRA